MRILIVDDDVGATGALRKFLSALGHDARLAASSDEAIRVFESFDIDTALVDLLLPTGSLTGVQLIRVISVRWPDTAIIVATGYPCFDSAVACIRAGVIDYLVKPIDLGRLQSRLAEAGRRGGSGSSTPLRGSLTGDRDARDVASTRLDRQTGVILAGNLSIDIERRTIQRNGQPLELTATQFEILTRLLERPGCPVSLEALAQVIEPGGRRDVRHLVRYHIHRLRGRIEPDPGHPRLVRTVKQFGYVFGAPVRLRVS